MNLRRLTTAFAVIVGLLAPVAITHALTRQQFVVLFGQDGRLAGSSLDMNFATGQYFGCNTSCLSIVRASAGTNLLPTSVSGFAYATFPSNTLRITPGSGLLIEEARTNQLLNSTVPATQTTGSLGTGAYTLWVNGSGSATMSLGTGVGCGVATATNGSPVNFTISVGGTCIVTVLGSLNAFQLEAGAFGTSLIITAGTTVARAADNITLIGAAQTAGVAAKAAFFQTTGANNAASARMGTFNTGGTNFVFSTSTAIRVINSGSGLGPTATIGGGGTQSGSVKSAFGMDAVSMTAIANGGVQNTSANPYGSNTGTFQLGDTSGLNRTLNGTMQRFAFAPAKGIFDKLTVP